MANGFWQLTIFQNTTSLNVLQGSEYTSVTPAPMMSLGGY